MKQIHKKIIASQARAFRKALSYIQNQRHRGRFMERALTAEEFREHRIYCAPINENQFPSINKANSASMARQAKAAREFYRNIDFSGAMEPFKAESAWALWNHMNTYGSRQRLIELFPVHRDIKIHSDIHIAAVSQPGTTAMVGAIH